MPFTTTFDPVVKSWWRLFRRDTYSSQKGRMVSLFVSAFKGVLKPQAPSGQNKSRHLMAGVKMPQTKIIISAEYGGKGRINHKQFDAFTGATAGDHSNEFFVGEP